MSKLQLVLFVDNELHKEFDKNLCEMGDLHNAVKEEDMTLRNNNTIED